MSYRSGDWKIISVKTIQILSLNEFVGQKKLKILICYKRDTEKCFTINDHLLFTESKNTDQINLNQGSTTSSTTGVIFGLIN